MNIGQVPVILKTDFSDLRLFRRGKVRDVYDLGDTLLIVSTDRISCFDVVLPCGIPHKGRVLTQLSIFWFSLLNDIVPNHFITADLKKFPKILQKYEKGLKGRSMLVKKAHALAVECIVRGYLSGSAWKEYKNNRTVCGIELPSGLLESAELPQIIFTPSTKADAGHDINVDKGYIDRLLGEEISDRLVQISIAIYRQARDYARDRGIIIADTKFEFGLDEGGLILIDEVLTPDSSRFWPKEGYSPGGPQPSFDKQFVRDYLESIGWNKNPPAPALPVEIIQKTSQKYIEAYERLTGKSFQYTLLE